MGYGKLIHKLLRLSPELTRRNQSDIKHLILYIHLVGGTVGIHCQPGKSFKTSQKIEMTVFQNKFPIDFIRLQNNLRC